jgi:Ca-activated chloride channel family protein
LWRRKSSAANWRAAIAPDLIDYLLEPAQQTRQHWPWLLFAGWLLATLALAGPTWEKLPQPVLQKRDGLVIVLDLSLSMYAEDIKPSRLQRARFKIFDILQKRREGLTGLVVYSGDAHVVSPLTDDTATIANLIPALTPALMPSYGSDAATGIDSALQLLRNSGFERGRILLISDEIGADDINKIAARIDGTRWQLALIGVGTDQGAPIPLPPEANQRGFLKQNDGTIAVAKLHRDRLLSLAAKTHGRYDDLRIDDSDIERVLPPIITTDDNVRTVEREFDQWRERGPQLVILLLPLAAFAFRRGWLLGLLLIPLSMPSQAWEWRDMWQRPDQQAQQDFNSGDTKAAAEKFQDPLWRGAAQYRSGDFANAAQSLQNVDSADAHYDRGNALAQSGKLQEALAAYDAALAKNPALKDAKANRDLVEKLLQQQKKNPQQNNSQQGQDKERDKKQQNDAQQQSQQAQGGNSKNAQQNNSSQNDSAQANAQNDQKQDNQNQNDQNQPNNANAQDKSQAQQQTAEQQRQDQAAQAAAENDAKNQENKEKNAQSAQTDKQNEQQSSNNSQHAAADNLTPEQQMQQRATEQWLRQIPDDPAGLLRRKFLYENRQREQQTQNNGQPLW